MRSSSAYCSSSKRMRMTTASTDSYIMSVSSCFCSRWSLMRMISLRVSPSRMSMVPVGNSSAGMVMAWHFCRSQQVSNLSASSIRFICSSGQNDLSRISIVPLVPSQTWILESLMPVAGSIKKPAESIASAVDQMSPFWWLLILRTTQTTVPSTIVCQALILS